MNAYVTGFCGALAATCLLFSAERGAAGEAAQPETAVACKPIYTAAQLNAIRQNLAGSYCLAADIDLGGIANFVPIGTGLAPFTGKLFGNNRVITNLTISNSAVQFVGLFGVNDGATIQDLGLINVNIASTAANSVVGGLAGVVISNAAANALVKRVFATGRVQCTGTGCYAGGLIGQMGDDDGTTATLSQSWSSAKVTGQAAAGGTLAAATSFTGRVFVNQSHATGAVNCTQSTATCSAGGLVGLSSATITDSFATGPVVGTGPSASGGLVGYLADPGSVRRCFATGQVKGGASATVGGLIGRHLGGTTSEAYAIGPVSGGTSAMVGGLIGEVVSPPMVTNAYWDSNTTGQMTSAGGFGTARTTAQFRNALPAGFGNAWAITRNLSYPFLNDADIELASPLATLVRSNKVFAFLPISQLTASEYAGNPTHTDGASLATVYTMIARAIGITKNVAELKGVKINKYFWNDSTQTTSWTGPVTSHATLGALQPLGATTPISAANVVGQLSAQRLVILRGTYTRPNGTMATHWMLATLFTRNTDNGLATVVAHDPWTGMQVPIDLNTKRVVTPTAFPLANFKVNGFRPVTIN